jgi:hypothetical protein
MFICNYSNTNFGLVVKLQVMLYQAILKIGAAELYSCLKQSNKNSNNLITGIPSGRTELRMSGVGHAKKKKKFGPCP